MTQKKLVVIAISSVLSFGAIAAPMPSGCDHFSNRSDFIFTSHHVNEIPKPFVGVYTFGEKPSDRFYVKFKLDEQGQAMGLFERAGRLLAWNGSVESIGKNSAGDQKLILRYTINRQKFGRMKGDVLRTIDSPGKMFIAMTPGEKSQRTVDTVGHFDNYVAYGQKYAFKQA